jgi:hypothetical protein
MGDSICLVHEKRKELFAGTSVLSLSVLMSPVFLHMATGQLPSNSADLLGAGIVMGYASFGGLAVASQLKGIGERIANGKDPLLILEKAGKINEQGKDGSLYLQKKMMGMDGPQRLRMTATVNGIETLNSQGNEKLITSRHVDEGKRMYNKLSTHGPEPVRKRFEDAGFGMA